MEKKQYYTLVTFYQSNFSRHMLIETDNAIEVWDKLIESMKNYSNIFINFKEKVKPILDTINIDDIYSKYKDSISKLITVSEQTTIHIKINLYNFKSLVLYKTKVWDLSEHTGNCVDRFLRNKLNSSIEFIKRSYHQIKLRSYERDNTNQYHQTDCYEKDYLQLCLIRNEAKKIVENCNKKLILLSEKYTKID